MFATAFEHFSALMIKSFNLFRLAVVSVRKLRVVRLIKYGMRTIASVSVLVIQVAMILIIIAMDRADVSAFSNRDAKIIKNSMIRIASVSVVIPARCVLSLKFGIIHHATVVVRLRKIATN